MGKIIIIRVPKGKEDATAAALAAKARSAGRKVARVAVKVPRKG